ncbi:MAG TPA: hypothetical protein ENH00_07830, partial [Actinobacteria bacterium]|nr:hypothetical protein [Actinomycetota bacterium]
MVTDTAAAIRQGEMSAVQAVSAALDRSESSQDTLNAYTLIDRESALARAETIDEMVSQGHDPGPLAGVPIAVKDLIDQAGLPTTCGSGFYKRIPERSATVV